MSRASMTRRAAATLTIPDGAQPEATSRRTMTRKSTMESVAIMFKRRSWVDIGIEQQFDKQDKTPSFLRGTSIAVDGGMSKVPELFSWKRYIKAVMFLSVTCLNVWNVIRSGVAILSGRSGHNIDANGLITGKLMLMLLPKFDYQPEILIALFELLILAGMVAGTCVLAVEVYRRKNTYRVWSSVGGIFFDILPKLNSFSALRMLAYNTPAVLGEDVGDLQNEISDQWKTSPRSVLMRLFHFALVHLVLLVIGFDAFLVKFCEAYLSVQQGIGSAPAALKTYLFLNQMLGVVPVQHVAKRRLLKFAFAGEDSKFQAGEVQTVVLWHALLTKRIWQHFRPLQSVALLITFDDIDIQHMFINELAPGFLTEEDSDSDDEESEAEESEKQLKEEEKKEQ